MHLSEEIVGMILSKDAINKLEILQKSIKKSFTDHIFENEYINDMLKNLPEDSLVMERSTGGNEDKVDMANPGGNKSTISKANMKSISESLGVVIASYIGEKSLL